MPSLEQLRQLLRADPDDPFVLYGLAQEYARLERWADAIAHYDRCLAVDPLYCYAYYHKARAQARAGDPSAAAATVRDGLDAARRAGDDHAAAELQALLESLE
jgi:tetratricopeptide (TPR) repeat protein